MRHQETGLVIGGVGGLYEVKTESGAVVACRALGHLKRGDDKLLVGDKVTLTIDDTGRGETAVTAVLPRQNALIRPPLANVSLMILTVAAQSPDPSLPTLDRMSAICMHENIRLVFAVTKRDLADTAAEELAALYIKAGFPVYMLSSLTGEGVEPLKQAIFEMLGEGEIATFAGASGVGKSTLLNALFPALAQETGGLSEKTGRGKHTTRSVSLFPCGRGYLADTPGFSLLDFTRFDFLTLENLLPCFPDIDAFSTGCKYDDCAHLCEEGCAVLEALKEGKISPSRHESYKELYAILKEKKKNQYK